MTNEKTSKRLCQKCSLLGIDSPLQLFQLNDDDAILMCKNVNCTFMSSASWESLIVKRDVSSLRSSILKKPSYSSARSLKSSYSSPLPHRSVDLPSRPSTPATEPSSSGVSSRKLSDKRSVDCSESSSSSSKDFVEDRRTLVPIAPFICGHAHTFSAFETRKLNKEGFSSVNPLPFPDSPVEYQTSQERNSSNQNERKRKTSDSDISSESSKLSSDSSPESSQSGFPATFHSSNKKVRKLIVSPGTLKKIVNGSFQIKIIENNHKAQLSPSSNITPKLGELSQSATIGIGKETLKLSQQNPKCNNQMLIHCDTQSCVPRQ